MKENVWQEFWNGARLPFGYKTAIVDQRGARIKKRLEVDLVEAEEVRLIFRLFLEGDNGSGQMGIKTIVNRLNANGHRTRQGATWGIGPVHVMLSNPVYAGNGRFNLVDSKTGARKADAEHVFSSRRS